MSGKQEMVAFSMGGLPTDPNQLLEGLESVGQAIETSGGVPLLRLIKAGYWVYGPENIEVEDDSEWAANPSSLMHGFACWGDGELLGERMVPFNRPAPVRGELPNMGAAWNSQYSMVLQCVSGEDKGTSVLYKTTSVGGRNAFKGFINALVTQLTADPQNFVPVVLLEVDSYQHKSYGLTFTPIINITRWVGFDGESGEKIEDQTNDESEVETPEPDQPEAPARRRRSAAAQEDQAPPARRGRTSKAKDKEPENVTPPVRRRRRKAGDK